MKETMKLIQTVLLVVVGMLIGTGCGLPDFEEEPTYTVFEGSSGQVTMRVQDTPPIYIEPPIKSDYENTPGYIEERRMRQEQNARVKAYQKELEQSVREPDAKIVVTQKPKHHYFDAYDMAKDFVMSRLKCPRTAKWPWFVKKDHTRHLGNGRYQISSYLDAQNGFGALIRVHFICIVQHTGGYNWRLINLTM